MTSAPTSHWAALALALAHLSLFFPGGPLPPASLPPCALEAVCPPAWLPPEDPGETCSPCPDPCPATPAPAPVCAAPEPAAPPEADPLGAVLAAVPGLIVALLVEAGRAVQGCRRRAAEGDDDRAPTPAPARRGGGVVR